MKFGCLKDYSLSKTFVLIFFAVSTFQFLFYLVSVEYWWVHAHYFHDIMPQSFANGHLISIKDVFDSFQMRAPNEHRARFLNYLFLSFDHKIRYFLLGYFFVPPQISPIISFCNVIATPLFLFLSVKIITRDVYSALIATAVFFFSIGYLSQIGMLFMAAKPIALFTITLNLWLAARLFAKKSNNNRGYFDCKGWEKWCLVMLLFLSFFIDEISLYSFMIITIMFPDRFFGDFKRTFLISGIEKRVLSKPGYLENSSALTSVFGAIIFRAKFAKDLLLLSLPLFLIMVSLASVVPIVTNFYHDWDFRFFEFNLNLKNDINFGGEFSQDTKVSFLFILNNIVRNFLKVFELSLIPWPALEVFGLEASSQLYTLGNPPIFLLFSMLLIVSISYKFLFSFCQDQSLGYEKQLMTSSILVLFFFFCFISVLQIKHVPIISGYNYGAQYCLPLALLVGATHSTVIKHTAKAQLLFFSILVIFAAANASNFVLLHKNWDSFHRVWNYNSAYFPAPNNKTYNFVEGSVQHNVFPLVEKDTSYKELHEIYTAWRNNELDEYLFKTKISTNSMSMVYELRLGDAARAPAEIRNCQLMNLPTTCSKHWR